MQSLIFVELPTPTPGSNSAYDSDSSTQKSGGDIKEGPLHMISSDMDYMVYVVTYNNYSETTSGGVQSSAHAPTR